MTSRRDFIKFGAAATASSLFVPRDLFAAYEKEAEAVGNDVVLRCCIMSDVHFDGNPKAKEVERFRRAIDFTYRYSADQPYKNFDALLVVGDMSNHGIESELTLFKKEMDAAIKPGTDTFLCMGNHEFYGGNQAYWQSVFGVEPNRRYERNGFRFIAISPEKGTMQDGDYLYMVDFLDRELADAYKADPEKPIFVFQHYPVSPTVYGGRGFDDWGAEDFFDTLQKYPTVVNFSGHTHYPINDPRCAWQGCFSAFGTGTLSYVCHGGEGPGRFQKYLPEDSRYAQFYIMEVRRDNSITILPYDLVTNSFFDIVYRVAKPGAVDSYDYTDKRYFNSQKPTWREGTTVKASCVDAYAGTVEFRQATCPDVVLGYRVDLREFDEKKNEWSEYGSRYFWSDYFLKDMPDVIKGTLLDLADNTKYSGEITALNPFLRESDAKLTFELTTPADDTLPPDKDAPNPKPNFYDVAPADGKAVNRAMNKWGFVKEFEKRGEPKIVRDDAIGADVFEFDGGADFYRSAVSADDCNKLRRVTIGATFMVPKDVKTPGAVFGDTQMGGVELSYSSDQGLALWAYINGRYKTIYAPVEHGRYVDAYGTYDGKVLILYVDGKEAARAEERGAIAHTTDGSARAFCLGADTATGGGGEAFFKGRIARACLYTWALTPEQIANVSKR